MTKSRSANTSSSTQRGTGRASAPWNSEDEVIVRANNLLVGRAAYETAVRLYPRDVIHYWLNQIYAELLQIGHYWRLNETKALTWLDLVMKVVQESS